MLVSLSTLYLQLLELLRDVADAKPMPYLTDISLPANMAQFLGHSYAFALKKHPAHDSTAKPQRVKRHRRRKASVKVINKEEKKKMKEDLGVSVERSMESPDNFFLFLLVTSVPHWSNTTSRPERKSL